MTTREEYGKTQKKVLRVEGITACWKTNAHLHRSLDWSSTAALSFGQEDSSANLINRCWLNYHNRNIVSCVNSLKKEQQRTSCSMLLVLLFHALSLVTVLSLLLCIKSYLQTTDDSHTCQPNATSFNVITCTRQVSTAAYGYGSNIPSNMGYCTYSDPQS